ncbi:hypothetical protein AQUCO_01400024v1 [Aquilegia coerulea]|uniref:RRM domain-containing protein n=1 Tax=Aquilegia coerulea TaxID=218851 RepID=A0A2G5DU32_AQUCA|nr:hypothetical protein AQUCO_01400024v1 [Aquilegia coerulea]
MMELEQQQQQQHSSNNSSSESESESEEEEDEQDENLHLQSLEKALADNPSDYDSHLNYIKSLRKLGHINKLRQARESMSLLFPLTPTLWQQWTYDETSLLLISDSPNQDQQPRTEAYDAITNLYERALHDYLSVSLWCDYLNFVQQHDPLLLQLSPLGISKIRDLFERAVPAAGFHVTQGNQIWEAYIKFEQTILHSIHHTNTEEKDKQVQRIRSLFHRQLSVPLYGLSSTLLAYKSWEDEQGGIPKSSSNDLDEVPSHISSAYKKAMEMYNERAHYEEQISRNDTPEEKLQHFLTYIKFEQSLGDPARVQILYERAVTELPVSGDLWLGYTRYLDETLKVAKCVLDVYSRATRNCTWIGELWVHYLLSLERASASEEKLSTVFEQSLQCAFSSSEEYLDLFLTRIDGLRRRNFSAGSTALDYSVVRDIFQSATEYLSPYLKNTDGLLRLHAYWARLELNHGKDLVAVRGVWESLLKTSGSMLEAWKQYIAMEIEMGHIDEARRIYKRCYSKRFTGTGSEDICHSWVRFEREFGTLEDYDHAARKVTPRLEELQLFRLQQESKMGVASVAQKEDPVSKQTPQKRKLSARSTDEHPTSKKQKGTAHGQTRSFEKETSQKSTEVKVVGSDQPKPDKPETIKEQQTKPSAPREIYTDQCTVFLSNLSFQAKDDNLRDFFSDVGGVTAIRLLKDKFTGKSRGLAYVDFSDDAHLTAALAKNKQILLGKKVSIARSDPKHNKRKESSGRSTREHGMICVLPPFLE